MSVYSSIFANDSKAQTDEMLEYLSRIIEEARKRDPTCRIVIGGDFNIPKLIDPENFLIFGLTGGDGDKLEDKFVRFIGKHDLETRNHSPTHDQGNVLDFFMVDRATAEDEMTSSMVH